MRGKKKQITFFKILGQSCPAQRDVSFLSRKMKATESVFILTSI